MFQKYFSTVEVEGYISTVRVMKVLPTFIALLLSISGFCQKDSAYNLKWKIRPDNAISYNTYMIEMDTAESQSPSINMDGFSKMFGDSSAKKNMDVMKQILSRIKKGTENDIYLTLLTKNKRGDIDIEMKLKPRTDSVLNKSDSFGVIEIAKLKSLLSGGVTLRGTITEGGAIESFYVKNDQRNLLALWYELPNKEVKVGESWPLDLHLISMDQNFKCDSSFRINKVTLTDVHKLGDQTIVVLNYDIEEYVEGEFYNPFHGNKTQKTMMKASYIGSSEFSIEKGRWISYNGIMTVGSSGLMTTQSEQKFSLIPN